MISNQIIGKFIIVLHPTVYSQESEISVWEKLIDMVLASTKLLQQLKAQQLA